jgi:hypothetical protein
VHVIGQRQGHEQGTADPHSGQRRIVRCRLSAIQAKTETLQQVSMKLGEHLYRAEQEAAAGASPSADAANDEPAKAAEGEVVDAEFTEVDDNKKSKN